MVTMVGSVYLDFLWAAVFHIARTSYEQIDSCRDEFPTPLIINLDLKARLALLLARYTKCRTSFSSMHIGRTMHAI